MLHSAISVRPNASELPLLVCERTPLCGLDGSNRLHQLAPRNKTRRQDVRLGRGLEVSHERIQEEVRPRGGVFHKRKPVGGDERLDGGYERAQLLKAGLERGEDIRLRGTGLSHSDFDHAHLKPRETWGIMSEFNTRAR
jgi:hypothetical protein